MATDAYYTVWQDVFHPGTSARDVYLKQIIIDQVLIVSFKEFTR